MQVLRHRIGTASVFTNRDELHRLVHVERQADIRSAMQREKNIKDWPRAWKIRLIRGRNPVWEDLHDAFLRT